MNALITIEYKCINLKECIMSDLGEASSHNLTIPK